MYWSELNPGGAFRVKTKKGVGQIYVKLIPDPFGSPIGDIGCVNVYTGETCLIVDLIDISKILVGQMELLDLKGKKAMGEWKDIELRFEDDWWWIYRKGELLSIIPFYSELQAIEWVRVFDEEEAERLKSIHIPF